MNTSSTLYLTIIATALSLTILSENVFGRYVDSEMTVQRRDPEQVPAFNPVDNGNEAFLEPDFAEGYDQLANANMITPEKRRWCQKYFIYNPVRGKCLPTVMAFKAMRTKSQRSFPNPQAWAKLW